MKFLSLKCSLRLLIPNYRISLRCPPVPGRAQASNIPPQLSNPPRLESPGRGPGNPRLRYHSREKAVDSLCRSISDQGIPVCCKLQPELRESSLPRLP